MDIRKSFFLIVCGLVIIACSGCATKTVRTNDPVELDSIQTIKPGKTVSIVTNKGVFIKDRGVFYLSMIVTDVNAERFQGNYIATCNVAEKDLSGTDVEVKVVDIRALSVVKTKHTLFYNRDPAYPAYPANPASNLLRDFALIILLVVDVVIAV